LSTTWKIKTDLYYSVFKLSFLKDNKIRYEELRRIKGGKLISRSWFNTKGQPHRENNLPAREYFDDQNNEELICQYWFWNGSNHRTDGPAIIWKDNKDNKPAYFIFGKSCEPIEWLRLVGKIKEGSLLPPEESERLQ